MSIGFIVARHRVGEGGGGAPNGSFDAACRSRITSSADRVGCTAEGRAFDEQLKGAESRVAGQQPSRGVNDTDDDGLGGHNDDASADGIQ